MASVDTEESPLLMVRTRQDLADWFGIPIKDLTGLAYSPRMRIYSTFSIPKRDGGQRTIHAPNPYLKKIQHILAAEFSQMYDPLPCVHGFVARRSIVSNAQPHTSRYALLCLDIRDFFPSITANRVYGLFLKKPFCMTSEVANMLTELVTYEHALPQGAPTSPALSNMICWRMDKQLMGYAKQHNLYYTRYADDITFSCTNKRHFKRVVYERDDDGLEIEKSLVEIIHRNGFELNDCKTHVAFKSARQSVTGVVVNKKCNMLRDNYRELRVVLHRWKSEGIEAAAARYACLSSSRSDFIGKDGEISTAKFRAHIRGRLDFYDMICQGSGHASVPMRRLWSMYHALVPEERVPTLMPEDVVFQSEYLEDVGDDVVGCTATVFLTSDLRLHTCNHGLPSCDADGTTQLKRGKRVICNLDPSDFARDELHDIACKDAAAEGIDNSGLRIDDKYIPQIGEKVIAYGFAEDHSRLKRQEALVMDVGTDGSCLVDRAFIKGMSGGPVFNTRGDVIGLVTEGSHVDNYVYDGKFQLIGG